MKKSFKTKKQNKIRTKKNKIRTKKNKIRTKKNKKKTKKNKIKSGATTGEWKDWFDSKMPGKPQFFKDITQTLKLASNVLQLVQNQVTIYLYQLKDIDQILLESEHEDYRERNSVTRIKSIINQLKKSPIFIKHLQKRNYGYDDNFSSEELWQIIQEEFIAKIISDFMKRSLEYQR